MWKAHQRVAAIVLAGIVWGAAAAPAQAPASVDPFRPDVLHEVRVRVHSRDWARLKATYLENAYYPCEVTIDGHRLPNLALRSRGTGSRNAVKPGLRVDVNRYVPGRREWGLSALVLDNLVQDASGLREVLAMRVFDRLGLPTPREAFARLYVNNAYAGLYALVEPIETPLLDRAFGDTGGHLFEYRWFEPWDFSPLHDPRDYAARFEPKTHLDEGLDTQAAMVESLVRVVSEASDEDFESTLGRLASLDAIVTHVAADSAIADNDGFAGNWGVNNVYFYRARGDGRWHILAWDKDQAFIHPDFFHDDRATNVLMRRALAVPRLRELYDQTLVAAADLFDVPAPTDEAPERKWLEAELDEAWTLVREAAAEDPVRPWRMEEVETAVEEMRTFARERARVLRSRVPSVIADPGGS